MKLSGVLYEMDTDTSYDYDVADVVLTRDRIAADWAEGEIQYHLQAKSTDGLTYRGTFGERRPDPNRVMELKKFTAADGSVLLFGTWHQSDDGREGRCLFSLCSQKVAAE
jgi:hypothetical protein